MLKKSMKTRKEGNYDKPKPKAREISFKLEKDILDDIDHQIVHSYGCIKRLVYYFLTRFGIRAADELHGILDCNVVLEKDEGGELIKYDESLSKNHFPNVAKFDDHIFRKPVWTHEKDFVLTYKQYLRHLPAKEKDGVPRHLFLQPIAKPRYEAWYSVNNVGKTKLKDWLRTMGSIVDAPQICNKSGRVTLVSRMAAAAVPIDVGMDVTGHKNPLSYQKYDRTQKSKMNACMEIVADPSSIDGNFRMYNEVLDGELAKKRKVDKEDHGKGTENLCNVPGKGILLRASEFCLAQENNSAVTEYGSTSTSKTVLSEVDNNLLSLKVPSLPAVVSSGKENGIVTDITLCNKGEQKVFPEIEIEEDPFSDEFYLQLNKQFPESAKALGKYTGPVINNQGGFQNCTFNIGVDVAQLAGVVAGAVAAAMNQKK